MSTLKGFRYPFKIKGGRVATSSGTDHLQQSIAQIVMCEKGSYLMLPEFGSGLPERVFDPVSLLALLWTDISDALRIWEKRIELVEVQSGPLADGGIFQLGAASTSSLESGVVGVNIRFRERGGDETIDMNLTTQRR